MFLQKILAFITVFSFSFQRGGARNASKELERHLKLNINPSYTNPNCTHIDRYNGRIRTRHGWGEWSPSRTRIRRVRKSLACSRPEAGFERDGSAGKEKVIDLTSP